MTYTNRRFNLARGFRVSFHCRPDYDDKPAAVGSRDSMCVCLPVRRNARANIAYKTVRREIEGAELALLSVHENVIIPGNSCSSIFGLF